ncbi:MAG TPA: glycosyltransferase [Pyrinomonadaceae bacterium]|nr:glycosyltransferase [Pyrinomonadaceae bacterium]
MKVMLCKGQFLGPVSGADQTLVTYATQLRRSGHAVSVLLVYPHHAEDQYYVRLRDAGVPVSTLASPRVGASLGAGRRFARSLLRALPTSRRLVREQSRRAATRIASRYSGRCRDFFEQERPDVVHVITPDPSAMVLIEAAHAAGVPVMYQEVGTPFDPPEYEAYYEQFTTVLPLCAEVSALSPLLAQKCRERLLLAQDVSVLPIMADDLRGGANGRRARADEINVGFASRIEHLKGALVLLEAFAAAARADRRLRLRIAGEGSLRQKVWERARELGVANVCEFTGVYTRPEQRKSFMEGLDVFVLPSLAEGTPNAIVEAMSHGLPVIASAVGGVPDVVTREVGLLVPPGDVAALAAALARLAADARERASMGEQAAQRYEELFSPRAVMPILLDTYRRIAKKAPPAAPLSADEARVHPWSAQALCEA